MTVLWKYLHPQRGLILIALGLAAISQLLQLVDPLIFGKIIDDYATNPGTRTNDELVRGVIKWLGIAIGVAMLARLAKSFQEYFTRLAVQKFGMQIFNEGLKQTLRLSFQEFEEQRSGETLSVLQKVRTDTQQFINAFINILFSSLVGMGFLIWYSVTKNWMLIPVFVIGILVLGSLTGLLSKKIKTTQRSINRETNKMSGVITESLRNIELVKSLGLTYAEIRRLRDQTRKIFELEMVKVRKVRALTFMQGTTLSLLKQSILFILLWLIFRQVLTTGELITLATKFDWDPVIAEKEISMLQPDKIEAKLPDFATCLRERHAPENWKTVLEKTAQMLRDLGAANALVPPRWSEIQQHVLLVLGDRDKMVSQEETMAVYRQLQQGQYCVLPGTAHPIELVHPELIECIIRRFFG